jgi:predicted DNA-binding transcriptional regulator AlpA
LEKEDDVLVIVEKPVRNEVMTVSDAAKFLKRFPQSIYQLVSQRKIPFHKPFGGSILYFLESELLEAVKRSKVSTAYEVSDMADEILNARLIGKNVRSRKDKKSARRTHTPRGRPPS